MIAACRAAGVKRLVHVGTEAALMHGQPLVAADERTPLALDSPVALLRHQGRRRGGGDRRQRLRPGDRGRPPALRLGRGRHDAAPDPRRHGPLGPLRWIGGGRQLTSTTHVDNTVEGLVLAAERGAPGNAYFVTDGSPVVFREFVGALLATQGVQAPEGELPLWAGRVLARGSELAWRVLPLPGRPPIARFGLWASALEGTVDDTKAREQLGYRPVITRDHGLTALQAAA